MDMNNSANPKKMRETSKNQIAFSSILLGVAVLAEQYVMINYPTNFIAIGAFAIVALGGIYLLITGIMQEKYARDMYYDMQFENLAKSEKASYLLLRKLYDELDKELHNMETSMAIPTQTILNAQKAIAKVQVNRSRENAEAIINSNDQMIEKLEAFESILKENGKDLLTDQKIALTQTNQDLMMKQQELLTHLKEMELQISRDMMQAQANSRVAAPVVMTATPQQTVTAVETPVVEIRESDEIPEVDIIQQENVEEIQSQDLAINSEIEMDTEVTNIEEAAAEEVKESVEESQASMDVEQVLTEDVIEEVSIAEEVPVVEEVPVAEEIPVVEEPTVADVDPNKMMSPDDIAALLAGAEEQATEESATEAAPSEVVEEEKPPMPDMSDPNAKMSPDDIAALFANLGTEETVSEPVMEESVAEEPVVEKPVVEEPVVEETVAEEPAAEEEKPPMPDLSDPNKMMSPEDIAALLANL